MIAEDNAINAMIASQLLEHLGFQTAVAGNGREAVEALKSSEPGTYSCIFMDVQMPVMDGLEATRAIRGLAHPDAKLPIFAMTANVFFEDIQKTREVGMQEHIGKPIDFAQLRRIVEKWFPRQAMEKKKQ